MITKIKLENFKSIQSQVINLRNLNVLIGHNGAGKSNFISFFNFLEKLSDQSLSEYIFEKGGIENFLFGGYERSKYIEAAVELTEETNAYNTYYFKVISNGEDYKFQREQVSFRKSNVYSFQIGMGDREASLKKVKNEGQYPAKNYAEYIYKFIQNLKAYHFHDTSDNSKSKMPQDIDDVYYLHKEGENIAPFLNFLKEEHPANYSHIVDAVRMVYPLFHDFVLQESPTARGKMILRWIEKGSDYIYSAKQISDGTLRFICLATLLLQPHDLKYAPKTILLDEPELGLHPFAIHVLAELIKKCAMNKQVILATQSVSLINYFEPEDLLIAERTKEGATVFHRKDSESLKDWLQDYSLGQLWESNLLGGRP